MSRGELRVRQPRGEVRLRRGAASPSAARHTARRRVRQYASSAASGSGITRDGERPARRGRATPPGSSPSARFPAASARSQPALAASIAPRMTHVGNGSSRTSSSGLAFGGVGVRRAGPKRGYPPSTMPPAGRSPLMTWITRNRPASAVGTASTACGVATSCCALVGWPAPRQRGHAAAAALMQQQHRGQQMPCHCRPPSHAELLARQAPGPIGTFQDSICF